MKLLLALYFLTSASLAGDKAQATCTCTCVVKDEEGKYSTKKASGSDREGAGEALKKALGKQKCELSPDCKGSC